MDLIILGVLGLVLSALGFLVMRDARRPAVGRQGWDERELDPICHASPCRAAACQGEACKAAPCHADLVRPVVDLSRLEQRHERLLEVLDSHMDRMNRLASEERVRDRDQHAELLSALRADVQGIADRGAETVIGLAEMCSDLGYAVDTAHDTALRQVRKERQKVLRDKIARARAARLERQ
jgi:hypothetical protein